MQEGVDVGVGGLDHGGGGLGADVEREFELRVGFLEDQPGAVDQPAQVVVEEAFVD